MVKLEGEDSGKVKAAQGAVLASLGPVGNVFKKETMLACFPSFANDNLSATVFVCLFFFSFVRFSS